MASSGLHANGYSLARAVVAQQGWAWDRHVADLGRTIGEELLEPTAVYAGVLVDLLASLPGAVHAISHVTGGGIAANLARVLPVGAHADVDRGTWTPPAVTRVLGEAGGVSVADRERTWNQGIGMVAVVAAEQADVVRGGAAGRGHAGLGRRGGHRRRPLGPRGRRDVTWDQGCRRWFRPAGRVPPVTS